MGLKIKGFYAESTCISGAKSMLEPIFLALGLVGKFDLVRVKKFSELRWLEKTLESQ